MIWIKKVDSKTIELMLHTLGISVSKSNKMVEPHKRYRPKPNSYRNYFNTGDEVDDNFEKLVEQGYAKKTNTSFAGNFYIITKDGIKYLKDIGYDFTIDKD